MQLYFITYLDTICVLLAHRTQHPDTGRLPFALTHAIADPAGNQLNSLQTRSLCPDVNRHGGLSLQHPAGCQAKILAVYLLRKTAASGMHFLPINRSAAQGFELFACDDVPSAVRRSIFRRAAGTALSTSPAVSRAEDFWPIAFPTAMNAGFGTALM